MRWWKRIWVADERLKQENATLEIENERLQNRIDILRDQNKFLSQTSAYNAKFLEDLTGRLTDYSTAPVQENVSSQHVGVSP